MTRRPIWRLFALVFALVAVTAACGDDDDVAETTEGDLAAACAAQLDVSNGFGDFFNSLPEPPEGEPTPEQLDAVRTGYREHIAPAVTKLQEVAPDEIKADVDRGAELLSEFEDRPDPAILEGDEITEVGNKIDGYFFENCEEGTAEAVTAVDYAYEDLPADVEAGPVRIKFENTGKELHELVLLGKADGVTESFDEILALPEEQAEPKTKFITAGFIAPGDTTYITNEIEAGDYIAICFISKGTVNPEQEVDGPPHFTLGMKQEITVS